ncbi:MAG: hypothetical protein ACI87E_004739 [Mariniblastus sp.]|jgi:uncharacterized protein (UPF0264 family)
MRRPAIESKGFGSFLPLDVPLEPELVVVIWNPRQFVLRKAESGVNSAGKRILGDEVIGLLISVKDTVEANVVSRFPVSILDIKDPAKGALGAAAPAVLEKIAGSLPGSVQLSFSAGELADWRVQIDRLNSASEGGNPNSGSGPQGCLLNRYPEELLARFRFVKIGLAGMSQIQNWPDYWRALFEGLPKSTRPVAVAYLDYQDADSPSPSDVIKMAGEHPNCSTILFDTFCKSKDLFGSLESEDLQALLLTSQKANLKTVVAGSVSIETLERVMRCRPDLVGVRGAVCRGGRADNVDQALVNDWIREMQAREHLICD